jgi:Vacuolar-sorting-associated 13 protein C-terminal/SHR-binding domain of vacuolar-sorting associated protein 13/N-terminal region of Chorein or VPS13
MNNTVAWCLAYLFNKYLSGILATLSPEQVLVSILKGNIELGNLIINTQTIKKSPIKLLQGVIKSIRLSIPWHKVMIGESCVIKLAISGVYLEFTKSQESFESSEDPQELKSRILQEFEDLIKTKKTNFQKIFAAMSSRVVNLEVIEFILSRLEIDINDIEVNYISLHNKDLVLSIESLLVIPTDDIFRPFPEENITLWNKIQSFGSFTFTNPSVTLSESLLQFKVISLINLSVFFKNNQTNKIINIGCINIKYSSKNYLWIGQSMENTYIEVKGNIDEVKFNINDKAILDLLSIFGVNADKPVRNAKEMWARAREAVFKKVRMRSWWFLTKKLLWKNIYQKLYAKYVLNIEYDPSYVYSQNNPSDKSQEESQSHINKYIKMIMPDIEYSKNVKENLKQRPVSDIIPAFHFNWNCPVKKLEQALMVDLEKNLEIDEILEYRQEVQNLNDFKEFEKVNLKVSSYNASFSKIYNYFKTKGGHVINQNENSRKVDLIADTSIGIVMVKINTSNKLDLGLYLHQLHFKSNFDFKQPNFRRKQFNYDRTSLQVLKIEKIELIDFFIKDSKMIKPIITFKTSITIELSGTLKIEYIKNCFNENIARKLKVNIPDISITVIPDLVHSIQKDLISFLLPPSQIHKKEENLIDLLECFQKVHINPKQETQLILNVDITKLDLLIASGYDPDSYIIKSTLGGISLKNFYNRSNLDIKYIEIVTGTCNKFQSVSSLFMTKVFTSSYIRVVSIENKTEVFFKTIQAEIDRNDLVCIFNVMQKMALLSSSDYVQEVIRVPLIGNKIESIIQRPLSSFILNIGSVVAGIKIDDAFLELVVKNISISSVKFLLESYICLSAREVCVVNTKNNQFLLHMVSEPQLQSFLPILSSISKDPLAAFYFSVELIDKNSPKYGNILSTMEFTYGSLYIGIDLTIIKWVLDFKNSLPGSTEKVETNETNLIINKKMIIHGKVLNILFLYQDIANYMFLSSDSYIVLDSYTNKTQLRLKFTDPEVIDLSLESSYHPYVFSSISESKLEMNYISKSDETVLEIRINNTKITFLTRVIRELYHYIYYDLMSVVPSNPPGDILETGQSSSDTPGFNQSPRSTPKSKLSLCLLFINSEMLIPRNSVTYDGFIISFSSLEISNSNDTILKQTQKFQYEIDLENKKKNENKGMKLLVISQLSWITQNKFSFRNKTMSDRVHNMDVDPKKIKSNKIVEIDGFEIFYYDPDEIPEFENQITRKSHIVDHSSDSEEDHDYKDSINPQQFINNWRRSSPFEVAMESPKTPSKKILRFDTTNSYQDVHSPTLKSDKSDESEKQYEEAYETLLEFKNCKILDYSRNEITTKSFCMAVKISNKDNKKNITVINQSLKMNLKLFQDQYYIILKSMQENSFELDRYAVDAVSNTNGETWMSVKVLLHDFSFIIINGSLNLFREKGIQILKIENEASLCKISLKSFEIKVDMKNNGSKEIDISSKGFKIKDYRQKSEFKDPKTPPLIYMYNDSYRLKTSNSLSKDFETLSDKLHLDNTIDDPIENDLKINIMMHSCKEISILFDYTIIIVLPDFLYDLKEFFSCPYNTDIFEDPWNVKSFADPEPPSMIVNLNLEKTHMLFLSSLDNFDSTCLLLRINNLDLQYSQKGNCYTGPGTMEVSMVIDLDGGHLVPAKYGLEFADSKYFEHVIECYSIKINYVFNKPLKDKPDDKIHNWATSQFNIRSTKEKDLNINLTFSGISTLKQTFKALSELSADPNIYKSMPSHEKIVKSPEKPSDHIKTSVNLALYGVSCNFFNEQMQPIFRANINEILSAYQQENSNSNSEANFIILIEVDYFNQKLTSWEPVIETWGLEVRYSCAEGVSMIDLGEYSNSLQINISAAFINTLSNIWPVIMNMNDNQSSQQISLEPYRFENYTGLPIRISINQIQSMTSLEQEIEDEGVFILKLEDLNKMNFIENSRSSKLVYNKKTLTIDINPPNGKFYKLFSHTRFRPVTNIGIDTPDTYFIYLEEIGAKLEASNILPNLNKSKRNSLGRISKIFIHDEEYEEFVLKNEVDDKNCFNLLKSKKYYKKKLAKGKIQSNSEEDYHKKISFLVDVQWKQEVGQRVVAIRSSISIVSMIPTSLIITFSQTDSVEGSIKEVLLKGNSKIPIPILAACRGRINIRPSDNYEMSKVIRRVNESIFTTNNLITSGTEGIVDKNMLSRVEYLNKGEIELGFIPLHCKSIDSGDRPFYCSLTVKKITNASPVRRIEQKKPQVKISQKGRIGFKKPVTHQPKIEFGNDSDEEFNLETVSDETQLIINSIISFTNALPNICHIKTWTEKPPTEYSILNQGETEHLYHLDFFKDIIYISISIKGYKFCEPLKIYPLSIDKEQKHCIVLEKSEDNPQEEKKSSNLYLWIRVIEDESKCWRFTLYSPYWIINKTDLKLKYCEPTMLGKKKFSHQDDDRIENYPEVIANPVPIPLVDIEINDKSPSKFSGTEYRYSKDEAVRLAEILKGFSTKKEKPQVDSKGWNRISLFSRSKIINKLNVAVNQDEKDSKWSQNFSLTNSGTSGELLIEGHDGRQFDLGVTIEKGRGIFQLTNIITFRPLHILKNNFNRELLVRQIDVDKRKAYWTLPPHSEKPIFWYTSKDRKALSVAVNLGEGHETFKKWSGGFSINELGEFIIRLPMDHIDGQAEDNFLQVSVISSDPMIIIQFSAANHRVPYRLENYTSHEIKYNQIMSIKTEIPTKTRILKPGKIDEPSFHNYTWDEEISPHILKIFIGTATKDIEFDKFTRYTGIKVDEEKWKEALLKKTKKQGNIMLKRKNWNKPRYLNVILSEKWLLIQHKKNPINLDFYCTKVVYIDDQCFELQSCTKSIIFYSNHEEDFLNWYEIIDSTVNDTVISTQLYANVSVELIGVTHVMKFENEDTSKSEKHHLKCKKAKKQGEVIMDMEQGQPSFTLNISISEIGFSIIDQTPQEKIFFYFRGLDLMYRKYFDNYIGLYFSVIDLKIDNQQASSHIPVILNPYFNTKTNITQEKTMMFEIYAQRLPELDNIKWLTFLIAPLEIKIDEAIISNIIDYWTFVKNSFKITSEVKETSSVEVPDHKLGELQRYSTDLSTFAMLELTQTSLIPEKDKDLTIEKRIYIHELLLGPLEFCVTLDKDNVDPTRSKKTNFIQILADLGLALTSIESTELRFAGFKIYNLLQPRSQFIRSMVNHYKSQGIRELYKIVGSVELLGNPFALINSLKAGVKEMIYDPAVALIQTPSRFVQSLLKGSAGLVMHTVHGLFKSVGTLTGGIGRFLILLTLDKKFQTKMRILKSRPAHNFGDKFKIGCKQVTYGFAQGLVGLITAPIKGVKQGGLPGLLKGIGKGIIGTVAKPTAGIVGTISDAFSGIGNFARKKHKVRYTERSRYPRNFNSDRILRKYDEASSAGQFYVTKYKKTTVYEKILFYHEIETKNKTRLLILSNKSIYVLRKSDAHGLEIMKSHIRDDPTLLNNIITINVSIPDEASPEDKQFNYANKKAIFKKLFIEFEPQLKEPNRGTFQIILRGIKEEEKTAELSHILNNYKIKKN